MSRTSTIRSNITIIIDPAKAIAFYRYDLDIDQLVPKSLNLTAGETILWGIDGVTGTAEVINCKPIWNTKTEDLCTLKKLS